jgi:hypothetical protein
MYAADGSHLVIKNHLERIILNPDFTFDSV